MATGACQSAPADDKTPQVAADSHGQAAGAAPGIVVHGSRAKEYTTLKALAQESPIVVRATAVDAVPDPTDDTLHVITTVKVTDSFRGAAVGATLRVAQIGGADTVVDDEIPPLLQVGREYFLFLVPTGMPSKAGQYYVTGQAGEFQLNQGNKAERLDKISVDLPQEITAESVQQAVKSTV